MSFPKISRQSDGYFIVHGIALLVAVLVLVTAGLSLRGRLSDTATVTARMFDIGGGVTSGADVKMRGLVVGTVESIEGRPGDIELGLAIERSAVGEIPAGVSARVLPASVFGTSYVELTPPASAVREHLADGDVIEQDRSQATLELQRALDSIDQLVSALGPADLSVVLHALAGALDGRGKELGETVERLDHLLGVVNPQMPLFREDLRLLLANVQTVRQVAPELLDTLEAGADVARGVVSHQQQIRALFLAALQLVDDADGLLDASERKYIRAILHSAGVVDAVYDNRAGVSAQVRALDRLMRKVLTFTDGGGIRADLLLVDPAAHDYYTSADCPRYGASTGSNCPGN